MSHRFRPNRLLARLLLTGAAVVAGLAMAAPAHASGDGSTPPPTGLRVVEANLTSVTVAWDPVVVPDHGMAYTTYISPGAGRAIETDATTVTFTNLYPGRDYTVHLESRTLPDWTYSAPVTLDLRTPPDVTAPSTPSGLRVASAGDGHATLTWHPSTDDVRVARYEVSSPDGALLDQQTTLNGDPADVVPLLAPGTTHTIIVNSVDGSGNRSQPASITFTMPERADHSGPSTPTGFQWNGEQLRWQPAVDNVTPATQLDYVISVDGVPTVLVTGGQTWSDAFFDYLYCVVALPTGTHEYAVRAVDGVGNQSAASPSLVLTN